MSTSSGSASIGPFLSTERTTRTSGWRARNPGSIGARPPVAKEKGTLMRRSPRGLSSMLEIALSASPMSSKMRRAWRCRSNPASVKRKPRVERSSTTTPNVSSRRAKPRLTDDLGSFSDRAAPDTLPSSAMRVNTRRSLRSTMGDCSIRGTIRLRLRITAIRAERLPWLWIHVGPLATGPNASRLARPAARVQGVAVVLMKPTVPNRREEQPDGHDDQCGSGLRPILRRFPQRPRYAASALRPDRLDVVIRLPIDQ